MGSFVRFKLVRERTHVSGTLKRLASSVESITSFSCIAITFRKKLFGEWEYGMERDCKWLMGMGNGEWGMG
jgi:hypothetical protein